MSGARDGRDMAAADSTPWPRLIEQTDDWQHSVRSNTRSNVCLFFFSILLPFAGSRATTVKTLPETLRTGSAVPPAWCAFPPLHFDLVDPSSVFEDFVLCFDDTYCSNIFFVVS